MALPEVKLGERLAQAIAMSRVSKGEFAKRIGVSASYLSQVLGDRKTPGAEFLFSVRRTFGVNVNWLLSGDGEAFVSTHLDGQLFGEIAHQVGLAVAASAKSFDLARALLRRSDLPSGFRAEDVRAIADASGAVSQLAFVIESVYERMLDGGMGDDWKERVAREVETHLLLLRRQDLVAGIGAVIAARADHAMGRATSEGPLKVMEVLLASEAIDALRDGGATETFPPTDIAPSGKECEAPRPKERTASRRLKQK